MKTARLSVIQFQMFEVFFIASNFLLERRGRKKPQAFHFVELFFFTRRFQNDKNHRWKDDFSILRRFSFSFFLQIGCLIKLSTVDGHRTAKLHCISFRNRLNRAVWHITIAALSSIYHIASIVKSQSFQSMLRQTKKWLSLSTKSIENPYDEMEKTQSFKCGDDNRFHRMIKTLCSLSGWLNVIVHYSNEFTASFRHFAFRSVDGLTITCCSFQFGSNFSSIIFSCLSSLILKCKFFVKQRKTAVAALQKRKKMK